MTASESKSNAAFDNQSRKLLDGLDNSQERLKRGHDELMKEREQRGLEIRHNDLLMQATAGGYLTAIGAFGYGALQTSQPLMRAPLFTLAALIAYFGMAHAIDRGRATGRLASYLRIVIEPQLDYMRWEMWLHKFRGETEGRIDKQKESWAGFKWDGSPYRNHLYLYILLFVSCCLGACYFSWDSFQQYKDNLLAIIIVLNIIVLTFAVTRVVNVWRQFQSTHSGGHELDTKWREILSSSISETESNT